MAAYLLSFQCFTEPFSVETLRWFAEVKRFLFKNHLVECSVVELTFFLMISKLLIYITQKLLSGSKHLPAKLHRNETRWPVYFSLTASVKDAFKKDENLFFQKIHSSSNFVNFPNLKSFWIFTIKNWQLRGKTFWRNHIIWYAFYSKFATFTDFEKIRILSKKPNNSSEKQRSYVFEKSY